MTELTIDWPLLPANRSPGPGEIEVVAADLRQSEEQLNALAATLSSDEQSRAGRFHFDEHRNRFIAGRGLLRAILGSHLNRDPRELEFICSLRGKPALAHPDGRGPLYFNLAHAGDLALVAVTRIGEIGVDIERVRPVSEAGNIVAQFFSPRERAGFGSLPDPLKPQAFFNLWTRKEAWLKATAEGIGQSLSQVEVSFLPDDPARLISLFGSAASAREWKLWGLIPAFGHVGALALSVKDAQVNCWRWPG